LKAGAYCCIRGDLTNVRHLHNFGPIDRENDITVPEPGALGRAPGSDPCHHDAFVVGKAKIGSDISIELPDGQAEPAPCFSIVTQRYGGPRCPVPLRRARFQCRQGRSSDNNRTVKRTPNIHLRIFVFHLFV
jgi:hypothetical protein